MTAGRLCLRAKTFCPGHITGFFEIHDQPRGILNRGSRGAGISITRGVTTEVFMRKSKQPKVEVFINGQNDPAPVTRSVISRMCRPKEKAETWSIVVQHDLQIPVGCGLGSSGAGAWGTALALNSLLELNLTHDKVGQIAHRAELANRTGLGTVLAQQKGGIEIRTVPGAPGIGHVDQIVFNPHLRLVCSSLGPISTRSMLTDPKIRASINRFGGKLARQMARKASPEELMRLSREFAEQTGLLSQILREGLSLLDEKGFYHSSMAMFGETIFSLVNADEVDEVVDVLKRWNKNRETFSAEIDAIGARLVECENGD